MLGEYLNIGRNVLKKYHRKQVNEKLYTSCENNQWSLFLLDWPSIDLFKKNVANQSWSFPYDYDDK